MSKTKIRRVRRARKEIFENYKCSNKHVNITIKQHGDNNYKVTYQNFVEKFLEQ
jgi:hypothetical protein